MKPAFSDQPLDWTRTPRDGRNRIERAYAGVRTRVETDGGWRSYALAVAVGVAIGFILANGWAGGWR